MTLLFGYYMFRVGKNQPNTAYYTRFDGQIIVASNEKKNDLGGAKFEYSMIYGIVWRFNIFRLTRSHVVLLFNIVTCNRKNRL